MRRWVLPAEENENESTMEGGRHHQVGGFPHWVVPSRVLFGRQMAQPIPLACGEGLGEAVVSKTGQDGTSGLKTGSI